MASRFRTAGDCEVAEGLLMAWAKQTPCVCGHSTQQHETPAMECSVEDCPCSFWRPRPGRAHERAASSVAAEMSDDADYLRNVAIPFGAHIRGALDKIADRIDEQQSRLSTCEKEAEAQRKCADAYFNALAEIRTTLKLDEHDDHVFVTDEIKRLVGRLDTLTAALQTIVDRRFLGYVEAQEIAREALSGAPSAVEKHGQKEDGGR